MFFFGFSFLFWVFIVFIVVVGFIIVGSIVFFVRRIKKSRQSLAAKEGYLQLALSKEDAVSQWFLLLSFFFLGVTLLSFNKDFGEPLSWRAILFIASLLGLIGAYYLKTIYVLVFSLIGLVSWWGYRPRGG